MRRARPHPRRGCLWTLIVVVAVILLTTGVSFSPCKPAAPSLQPKISDPIYHSQCAMNPPHFDIAFDLGMRKPIGPISGGFASGHLNLCCFLTKIGQFNRCELIRCGYCLFATQYSRRLDRRGRYSDMPIKHVNITVDFAVPLIVHKMDKT
jgi:hypothetical protein